MSSMGQRDSRVHEEELWELGGDTLSDGGEDGLEGFVDFKIVIGGEEVGL